MHTTLVSTDELQKNLGSWRVFDCRHDLMKPDLGEQQYRESHIPGALFAHLDRDLSAPRDGRNGRHPLPYPGAFLAWLGQQGLKRDDQIVCYDAGPGTIAARLWWMLRWIGHDGAAVLDGGLAKWLKEGRPMSSEIPRVAHNAYPARVRENRAVGVGTLEQRGDKLLLLDARAPARFRGEQEPIDRVAGHIPGALNRPSSRNLGADGTFRSPRELRSEFDAMLHGRRADDVVHYCGSGISACHNVLAMAIAGYPLTRLYPGSWSEWSADPKRPIARGQV